MLIGRVKSQVIFRISEMSKCLSILSDFLFNPIPCWLFRGLFCGGETNFLTLSKTGWNFARKLKFGMQRYTDIKFQKLYLFVGRLLQFCWCQNFVAKSQGFFEKVRPLLKAIVWELYLRVFVLISVLVRWQGTAYENITLADKASGFRLPNWCELDLKKKNDNDVGIFQYDVMHNLLLGCCVSLVKFRF